MSIDIGRDRGYSLARESLIAAARTLDRIAPGAIILVGAHAVYLRTPDAPALIEPFTFDGDVVADPRIIRLPRVLSTALGEAGFSSRGTRGLYHRADVPLQDRYATRFDVFVPERFQNEWLHNTWSHEDDHAAFSQPGLEFALVDHSPLPITHLGADAEHAEPLILEVAGIAALTIAKAWKIGERHEQGAQAFAEVSKDLVDIYRLLYSSRADDIESALEKRFRDRRLNDVTAEGGRILRALCSNGADGHRLFNETIADSEEFGIHSESFPKLVNEFCELVESGS